jgi:hypothetical protein
VELLIALAWGALLAAAAAADGAPRVVSVEPVRAGELVACRVVAEHLPGEKLWASMRSGLPSAIELELDVLDVKDRVVAGNRVTFRLAFDLWEETFRVEGGGTERDFTSSEELEAFLARLPRLPVAPFARLEQQLARRDSLRVRVGIVLHPLAPRESARLGEWVAGDSRRPTDPVASEDGREAVVSLGTVIRYFFEGARKPSEVASEAWSAPFVIAELAGEAP